MREEIKQIKVLELKMLLCELALNDIETVEQVKGIIDNRIDELKGRQYEVEANLDHLTENQFNG